MQELQEKVKELVGSFNQKEWQFAINTLHNNDLIDIKKIFEETMVDIMAANIEWHRYHRIGDVN